VSHPISADLGSLISTLTGGGVEFIVVGGAAAVLHGAPVTTLDLDIVHEQSEANVQRLTTVLRGLDATRLGPLDILCRLHDGRGYVELLPNSVVVQDGTTQIRIVGLADLIAIKSSTGRARDQLVVPILLALLRRLGG
jgi:hypothetical protein